jgi:hypothetical protein
MKCHGWIILAFCIPSLSYALNYFQKTCYKSDVSFYVHKPKGIGHWFMHSSSRALKELVELNREFFSIKTVKVFTALIPPYLIARKSDEEVHCSFYDCATHSNKNQLPRSFSKAVNSGGDVGILLLSMPAIFSRDCRLQNTSRIFALGAMSGLIMKDLIKSIAKTKSALRPFNEQFERKKTFGGFPSGHMIEASYMATVWGWQYGYKFGVPLGLFAGIMFGVLVNSNRHYASQVVAGAAVGISYGIAANSLIDRKIPEYCSIESNDYGTPGLKLSCAF